MISFHNFKPELTLLYFWLSKSNSKIFNPVQGVLLRSDTLEWLQQLCDLYNEE